MKTLSSYPEYKPSGVERLGEIPAHWQVKRMRFSCVVNPSKAEVAHRPLDTKVSFLPMEQIGEDGRLSLEWTRTLKEVTQGFTYFRDSDVVVAKITPCFENGKGAICKGLVNGIGFGTTELIVLRPNQDVDSRFVFYVTKATAFRAFGTAMMYGSAGQQRVPEDFVRNFRVGLPCVVEQQAIADFLDRETARIDGLVAKKERLIELLQEKRTALISHAVTKGLNPNAPMKDSGVDWLGQIPAHWDLLPLTKYMASQADYRGKTPTKTEGGVFLVTTRNIRSGRIDYEISQEFVAEEEYAEVMRRGLPVIGDILLTMEAPLGETANVDLEHIALAQRIIKWRTKRDAFDPYFVKNSIMADYFQRQLQREATGSTALGIKASKLHKLRILHPALDEQEKIVGFIDRETTKLDALMAKIRTGIERLQEYRTALISAAVTGKIDVRQPSASASEVNMLVSRPRA